jgi:hypothetical protein
MIALVLVDRADGQGSQRDGRVHADGEGHRQRLAPGLGDLGELPQVLAERQMDGRGVAPLEHQAVVGAVPGLAGRILGERDGGGHVRAGVALVVNDLRQRAEIDVLAAAHDFLHRAGGHDPRRDRALHGAQVGRQHGLGGRADGGGQP